MSQQTQDTPVLTVTQITNAIKHNLEAAFPNIWIQGEVSNAKLHSSGHFYFSIKDPSAQIGAVMFRAKSTLKTIPKDGDNIMIRGSINVYPPSGRYQIVVSELKYVGVGELLLKLEELKKEIAKRGWFKPEHKKPLPKMPKRIGVITSPTGAAIQDIVNVLTRRFAGVHLTLYPVRVQGETAAGEIALAIQEMNRYNLVDVMIVGRGGGSIEDLWAFNEEIVAKAIFESKIPIVGAVGHETDHTIAEYVADVRAPTPSAAAEIVVAEQAEQLNRLQQATRQIDRTLGHILKAKRHQLDGIMRHPLFISPYQILGPWMQKCDDLRHQIDLAMKQSLIQNKMRLDGNQKRLKALNPLLLLRQYREKMHTLRIQIDHSVKQFVQLKKERLKHVVSGLQSIDPKKLLTQGYSILLSEKERSVINSISSLQKSRNVRVLVSDGEALATIEEVFPSGKEK